MAQPIPKKLIPKVEDVVEISITDQLAALEANLLKEIAELKGILLKVIEQGKPVDIIKKMKEIQVKHN